MESIDPQTIHTIAAKIPRGLVRIINPDIIPKQQNPELLVSKAFSLKSGANFSSKDKAHDRASKVIRRYKIHRWKNIKTLDFNRGENWIGSSNFEALFLPICRYFDDSKGINLDFSLRSTGVPLNINDGIKVLSIIINRTYVGLQHLGLVFWNSVNFSQQTMNELPSYLFEGSRQLKSLCLRFDSVDTLSSKSFEILGKGIARNLINLKQLKLHFGKNAMFAKSITDYGLLSFIKELCRHRGNLTALELGFNKYDNVHGRNMYEIITCIGTNFTSLKVFKFRFEDCWIETDLVLQHFGLGVSKYMKQLQALELSILSTHYPLPRERWCAGFSTLGCEVSRNLPLLERFKLDLSPVRLNDADLICAANEIGQLKNLRQLSISFKSILEVSDKGLIEFVSGVAKKLPNLEQFELVFESSCCMVTGPGLVSLASEIANSKVTWKEFVIKYKKSWNITKEDETSMTELLGFIPNTVIEVR